MLLMLPVVVVAERIAIEPPHPAMLPLGSRAVPAWSTVTAWSDAVAVDRTAASGDAITAAKAAQTEMAAAQAAMTAALSQALRPGFGWRRVGRADPKRRMHLTVGVRHPYGARQELERILMQVSDPDNTASATGPGPAEPPQVGGVRSRTAKRTYGEHLSADEVEALLAPQPAHVERVLAWLLTPHRPGRGGFPGGAADADADADTIQLVPEGTTASRDLVTVELSVAAAERLLQAEYHVWEETAEEEMKERSGEEKDGSLRGSPHAQRKRRRVLRLGTAYR